MELRCQELSHSYGGLTVLDAIDLTVPAGKIVCIVGPSGCGKSTLLRLMGGLEQPTSGAVLQSGDRAGRLPQPAHLRVSGFRPAALAQVAGNVMLPLEEHGLSAAESRSIVDDVLARTRLSDFRDALPRQLSGGMRQRVAIARALAVKPAVWLMDEPLSALDSQTRDLLMDDLVDLWTREPFTAVYVTHNLAEAVRLGHHIVVLSRRPGRVRETVEIDVPLAERQAGDPRLAAQERQLWQAMRDEAQAADRELVDG